MNYVATYPQKSSKFLNLPNVCKVTKSRNNDFYITRLNSHLCFREPKLFSFSRRQDGLLLHFVEGEVELEAFENNINDLKSSVCDELCFLWAWYAEEKDDNLTDNAKKIKNWLRRNLISD